MCGRGTYSEEVSKLVTVFVTHLKEVFHQSSRDRDKYVQEELEATEYAFEPLIQLGHRIKSGLI